jgi:hypothetical protein
MILSLLRRRVSRQARLDPAPAAGVYWAEILFIGINQIRFCAVFQKRNYSNENLS